MRGLSVKRLFYGLGLAILNVAVIWCAIYLWGVQSYGLLALLLLGALALNALFIFPGGYPYRYLAPAAVFMILLVIYPIVYTVYVALTNYGTGNILTKEQVIQQFENRYVLDPDAGNYTFRVYENAHSDRIFLFTAPDGRLLLGRSGELEDVTGRDEADVIPPGYSELERRDVIRLSTELSALTFEYEEEYQLRMRSASAFALYIKQYSYDAGRDELVDLISGVVYKPVNGAFEAPDGTPYTGVPSLSDCETQRLFGNPQITGPFVRVFLWTITWALLSVGTTFAVGLF